MKINMKQVCKDLLTGQQDLVWQAHQLHKTLCQSIAWEMVHAYPIASSVVYPNQPIDTAVAGQHIADQSTEPAATNKLQHSLSDEVYFH
jgi:hypothetical protein